MPNGFSYLNQLVESISNERVIGWYFSFFIKILINILLVNSGDHDQTPLSAASDLDLYGLYVT